MTSHKAIPLKDDPARRTAMCSHDRSLLVEAGAGSGKTALMAGRVAIMLADGISPSSIAAVTFTELAASELLARIRKLAEQLTRGEIATELQIALSEGLSPEQVRNLETASAAIDEITCTTIHGFCQSLIKPYPVEADIDPGAKVMDAGQANLSFADIKERWLHEQLSGDTKNILAELVLREPYNSVELVRTIARNLRSKPTLSSPSTSRFPDKVISFKKATSEFTFVHGQLVWRARHPGHGPLL